MNIELGTYSDFVAVRGVLGAPKAFLYRYVATPESAMLVAIYDDGVVFFRNSITVDPPTPAEILTDFPEAKAVSQAVVS